MEYLTTKVLAHGRALLLIACTFLLSAFAQGQNRYFVYLTDKGASSNNFSLANPGQYLSERALARRTKESIAIDSTDIPVNEMYLQEIANTNAEVFFASKWLNGVLIQANDFIIGQVEQLPFVDSIRLVANGTRLVTEQEVVTAPEVFNDPPEILGDSDIQLLMLGADVMHADSINGEGVQIAVFDNGFTGINRFTTFQHAWENNQIIATKDFVENSGNVFQFGSHGTAVLSTIGADYRNDSVEFQGIANRADFILCVTEDNQAENTIEEYNWVFAAEYADSIGVDVINSSLGYRTFDIDAHDYSFEDLDGNTSIISSAAEMSASKGIIVVTSAGNSGRRSSPGNLISHPGDADSILVVGSVDPDFTRSAFSSIGPTSDGRIKPDVAAFGNGTAVMRGNGDIERGSGTSFASPLIAGFAAGIVQKFPEWTSQEVIAAIKASGHQANAADSLLGYGVPNYTFISDAPDRRINVNDILEDKITFYPNPFFGEKLFFITEGDFEEAIRIRILDPTGSYIYNEEFLPENLGQTIEIPINSVQQGVYYLFLQSGATQRVVKLINF